MYLRWHSQRPSWLKKNIYIYMLLLPCKMYPTRGYEQLTEEAKRARHPARIVWPVLYYILHLLGCIKILTIWDFQADYIFISSAPWADSLFRLQCP